MQTGRRAGMSWAAAGAINGEKVDYTAQLAQGLPPGLLKEARDYLRREKPEWGRERVEREAVASVRAYMTEHTERAALAHMHEAACLTTAPPEPEENPEEYTPLVMAAKHLGIIGERSQRNRASERNVTDVCASCLRDDDLQVRSIDGHVPPDCELCGEPNNASMVIKRRIK